MSMSRNVAATTVLLTALLSVSARGQTPTELDRRNSLAVSMIQTRPQGALARNIGFGYGLNGSYLFRLDHAGIVSIRSDIGVVDYGNESKRSALSEAVGDRIQVNVRTTNYMVPVSIGPQLTWPTGSFRPYVNAGFGGQWFFTESDVEATSDRTPFASTTNQTDFSAMWTTGAGIYVPVVAGKTNVQLDFGVQYLGGGSARYLAPGSIADLPDGHVRISPMESATHVMVVRIGARIRL